MSEEPKSFGHAQVQGRTERLATAANLISEALDIVAELADEMETILNSQRPDEREEQESVLPELAIKELDEICERINTVDPGAWKVEFPAD